MIANVTRALSGNIKTNYKTLSQKKFTLLLANEMKNIDVTLLAQSLRSWLNFKALTVHLPLVYQLKVHQTRDCVEFAECLGTLEQNVQKSKYCVIFKQKYICMIIFK